MSGKPLFLLLVTIVLTKNTIHCQSVPPMKLMFDFVDYNIGKTLVLHANTQNLKMAVLKVAKEINKQGKFAVVASYNEENCTIPLENVDVHSILLDSQKSINYIMSCFKHRKRRNREPWMLQFQEGNSIMDVANTLEMAELDLDDDIIVGINNGSHVDLFEIYKIAERKGPIEYNNVGSWSDTDGFIMTTAPKYYRRGDLKGHHFKVETLPEAPYTTKMELNPYTGKYEIEGSFPELLKLLSVAMNFTYTVTKPPDGAWGGYIGDFPNGKWNGMMNQVVNERIDFAATSLIITLPRVIDADWTTPLVYGYIAIFVKNPAGVVNYQAYLEPMTYLAWGMVVVFLIVIPPFLYIVFALNPNPHDNMSLAQSYGAVFVAMILLGSPNDPKNVSTRIIFLSILVACILIFWHWEAMLVSYLATRKIVLPFTTIADFYLNTNFRLAVMPDTTYMDNFKYSTDPLFLEIYAERIEPHVQEYKDYPQHTSDMMYFIRDDASTALLDGYVPIKATKEYSDCQILVTEGQYFNRPYAWPFPKHSPFLQIFNFYIGEMFEKGQWNAIQKKYEPMDQVCPDMSGSPIEVSGCIAAFVILVGGAILAFLSFGLEFVAKPFDHFLDPIRKKLGDHSDDNGEELDPIKTMDRETLELTIIKQRDAIEQMKMEVAMYRKTSQSQFFQ